MFVKELCELQSQIKDTSVIVEIDTSRNLDMDAVVAEVKAQYEAIASQSRKEDENWYNQNTSNILISEKIKMLDV